jgi:hypothetical protein
VNIQIELWALITFLVGLLVSFFGAVWAFGKILMAQFDKRLDLRFEAQEKARAEASLHWNHQFATIEKSKGQWERVERDFLNWKADMPLQYVRREDYIRNQTVIEAKLDAVAMRIENLQLKGAQR